MRYLYAAMWLGIFSWLGWYVYTGEAANYHARKGRFLAELLSGITGSIGALPTALLCVGVGVAFAAWAIFGKDGEEEA